MTLLFVDCCISQRGNASRTGRLCHAFLEAYQAKNPSCNITVLDLKSLELQPFTAPMLNKRDRLRAEGAIDDPIFALSRQFIAADRIVVGAPFWEETFPSLLKLYIEHVSACGVAYFYDDAGSHGLCRAEKLLYLTTGGSYAEGPLLGAVEWEALCAVYGIGQFDSIFADGLDVDPTKTEGIMQEKILAAQALAAKW